MTAGRGTWDSAVVREHLIALIEANDRRYEARFCSVEKMLITALSSQEKALLAALASSDKAIGVAEANSMKWRDNANEWRGAMSDRETKFVTSNEFNLLKERIDKSEGNASGISSLWIAIALGVSIVVGLIGIGSFVFANRSSQSSPQVVYLPAPQASQKSTVERSTTQLERNTQ